MSVKEVTYFKVVCDEPDCGFQTGDTGSDYTAWGDHGSALDDWINGEGISTDDGSTFCREHSVGKVCVDCTEVKSGIVKDVDGEHRCPDCAAEMRKPCDININSTRLHIRPYCNTHGRVVLEGVTKCSDADVFATS